VIGDVLLGIVAFVIMEPMTALLHRVLFHGRLGYTLHRSHHVAGDDRFEANDLYPVLLAAVTIVAIWLGVSVDALGFLAPIGAGVTAYGAAYAFVHDVYIHRRIPVLPARVRVLEPLREGHRIHHLYSGAPYGMLVPVVPAALRARATRTSVDPLAR
jgi:beta-carotene 3-hydroxylase